MKNLSRILIFFAFVLMSSCTSTDAPPLEVLYAASGTLEDKPEGGLRFNPTETVPRKTGQRYGWFMRIRTNKEKVKVVQEVVMTGPTTWDGPFESIVVADDKRSARVTLRIPVNVTADSGNVTGIPANVTEGRCCAF